MMYRILLSLILSFISVSVTYADMPQFPGAQNMPADFPQMSEKDLNEMITFLDGLSDEELKELENLGRQVLTDMGYDADTLEPLNPNTPPLKDLFATPAQPGPAPSIPETALAIPAAEPIVNTDELEEYLKKFLQHLQATQHKTQTVLADEKKLSRWIPEMRDLNFYITIIAHSEHIKRLLAPEYAMLLKHIKDLGGALITYEPLIIAQEPIYEATDDAYEILGITAAATPEDIEAAYEKIKEKKSPESVKERMTKENASERDIKRAVKEAQLTMSLITDAYEKLQDPKVKEQIDRERRAHTQQKGTLKQGAQKALNALSNAFSTAIYTHQLLNELEQFLKKYEPQKLEQKKALEKAEEERKKEQAEAAKRKITPTPGGQLEQQPRTSSGGYEPYGGYRYDQPYYPDYYGGSHGAEPNLGGKAGTPGTDDKKSPTGGAKKPGEKGKDEKGGDKDKGGKEGAGSKGSGDKGSEAKKPEDELKKLFDEIEKPFKSAHELVTASRPQTEIHDFIEKEISGKAEKITASLKKFAKGVSEIKDTKIKNNLRDKWKKFIEQYTGDKSAVKKHIDAVHSKVKKAKEDKINTIIDKHAKIADIPEDTVPALKAAIKTKTLPTDLPTKVQEEIEEVTSKPNLTNVLEHVGKVSKKLSVKQPDKKS